MVFSVVWGGVGLGLVRGRRKSEGGIPADMRGMSCMDELWVMPWVPIVRSFWSSDPAYVRRVAWGSVV